MKTSTTYITTENACPGSPRTPCGSHGAVLVFGREIADACDPDGDVQREMLRAICPECERTRSFAEIAE